jgi:branched-chain amino acid transport system permease protein
MQLVSGRFWLLALWIIIAIFLLSFPFFASTFFVVQIGIQSLFLCIVALSLIFLAGYGGMVSMAQIALYGASGYLFAIFTVSYNLPWYVGVLAGLLGATLLATLFGLVAVRTQGIYFLMITLAQAMLVYFYANQDRVFLGGHTGINGVRPPTVGSLVLADPTNFYYMALLVTVLVYSGLRYLMRTPFGLAFQGARDNAQRMQSLGYNVTAHRIVAFVIGGFVAGISGILSVWYNGSISPGSIDLTRNINILVIAVLGGMTYLEGAFVGAIFFTLTTNFASSYTNRFNTVIGLAFLLVALFFPDGLIGLSQRIVRFITRIALWRGKNPTSTAIPTSPSPTETAQTHVSGAVAEDKSLMTIPLHSEEEEKKP